MNLKTLLSQVGVTTTATKFKTLNSLDTLQTNKYTPYIGALYQAQPLGLKITQVLENSPAAEAGLAVNDILVAVNGMKTTEKSLQAIADHLPENTIVSCNYFRDDKLITRDIHFIDSPSNAITLSENDSNLSQQWLKIIT